MLLRATDCKYRESLESCKISLFILFFPKGPFDEPFSNIISKSSSALCFLRKIEKFQIRLNGPLKWPPRKTMKNCATSAFRTLQHASIALWNFACQQMTHLSFWKGKFLFHFVAFSMCIVTLWNNVLCLFCKGHLFGLL